MKLLLVRHGQMAGDPYLCPDRPVSGCLSPEGVAQARALGRVAQRLFYVEQRLPKALRALVL